MPKPWQVLASRTIHENAWFGVLGRTVRLPDGKEIDFQSVEFHRPAVGVVVARGDELLLIRQYRLTVDREVWAIPSGGIDAGETAEAAALRELREETGMQADRARALFAYHPSYGSTNQTFETFLVENPRPAGEDFDRNEVLEVRWFPRAEVLRMLFAGEIVDGLSATPLALLFLEANLAPDGPRLHGGFPGN